MADPNKQWWEKENPPLMDIVNGEPWEWRQHLRTQARRPKACPIGRFRPGMSFRDLVS